MKYISINVSMVVLDTAGLHMPGHDDNSTCTPSHVCHAKSRASSSQQHI
jgi:hypothetical protein